MFCHAFSQKKTFSKITKTSRGGGGGRGGAGGRGRGGMKGGAKVIVEPHRHEGIFVARGKEDALVTKNSTPGVSVYGEKRISVEATTVDGAKVEYRVWNPFRSKLAAAVLGGVDDIWIKPGYKVLYLGAAAGTSVSHVSDIVGPEGCVYAVEFSHRPGRDLINMAKARTNVIPIIEVRRNPVKVVLETCNKTIFSTVGLFYLVELCILHTNFSKHEIYRILPTFPIFIPPSRPLIFYACRMLVIHSSIVCW